VFPIVLALMLSTTFCSTFSLFLNSIRKETRTLNGKGNESFFVSYPRTYKLYIKVTVLLYYYPLKSRFKTMPQSEEEQIKSNHHQITIGI